MRTPDNAAFFDLIDRTPLYRKILRSMLFDLHTQVNLILERRGMTRTELARLLGKSDAEVSKWFSGTHNLTLESVAKIAAALEEDVMVVPERPRGYFKRPSVRALAGEKVELSASAPTTRLSTGTISRPMLESDSLTLPELSKFAADLMESGGRHEFRLRVPSTATSVVQYA